MGFFDDVKIEQPAQVGEIFGVPVFALPDLERRAIESVCRRCHHLPMYCRGGGVCDFTDLELDEVQESLRDDADHSEVAAILGDPGIVVYVDPFTIEEEEDKGIWLLC